MMASSQNGGWISKVRSQEGASGSCIAFYTLALEITQCHFYGAIFTQEVSFREREHRLHLLKEEYQHIEGRTCRNEYILVYPSLKNTTCYRH